jgi:hypothetical protein
VGEHNVYFCNNLEFIESMGFGRRARNVEPLSHLLSEFFRYVGERFDYRNHVVSIREGREMTKDEKVRMSTRSLLSSSLSVIALAHSFSLLSSLFYASTVVVDLFSKFVSPTFILLDTPSLCLHVPPPTWVHCPHDICPIPTHSVYMHHHRGPT